MGIKPRRYIYKILKLEDLFRFEIAKFMHQFTCKKLPTNFNHYFTYISAVSSHATSHSSNNDIFLPRLHSARTQRSIKFIGAKLWNDIPFEIKKLAFNKFKESYKSLLLNNYNVDTIIY